MKSLKSIAGIFACASILLTGCEKEFKAGEDTTKPVPTDLQYDVEYSRPDTMAVCWNAAEAIAAGATSFNVELCDSPDDAVNTYDDNILTVKVLSARTVSPTQFSQKEPKNTQRNMPAYVQTMVLSSQNGHLPLTRTATLQSLFQDTVCSTRARPALRTSCSKTTVTAHSM